MKTINEIIEAINTLGAEQKLSEADASSIARAALAVNQQPAVIWQVADIVGRIEDMEEGEGLSDAEIAEWAERAADTGWFRSLEDANDSNWYSIDEAISEAKQA